MDFMRFLVLVLGLVLYHCVCGAVCMQKYIIIHVANEPNISEHLIKYQLYMQL